MYWSRIWKKIHRPLLAFAIIGFMVVTASNVDLKAEDVDSVESDIEEWNDRELLVKSVAVESKMKNDGNVPLLGSVTPVPVAPVRQLPYCKNNNDKAHSKTSGDESSEYESSNSTDEIAVASNKVLSAINAGRTVLVATLDGQLSLLDHAGRILWSISTGQVFSSTISSLQLNENGKWINLIPSLTGGLYKYDGNSLHPMPVNAETLLRRSFKLSNDVVMTGGKELRTFGIDLTSGNLRYECGIQGCTTPSKADVPLEQEDLVLVVKKQLQTVRAIDSASGSERWNFSVATHELALAGVTEGCYEAEEKDFDKDHLIKVVIPEGLIIGADEANHSVWQHKFSSPISQAWVLEDGRLKVIDPITHSALLEESPALYIGMHKQQFYVQESQSTAEKLENAFALQLSRRELSPKPVAIGWKPSAAIEGMQDNKALTPYHPEFHFPGFYIFEKEEVRDKSSEFHGGRRTPFNRGDSDESDKPFDFTTAAMETIIVSLWVWWKEVLGISLLTAVIVHLLVLRPMIRAERTQLMREIWATIANSTSTKDDELALVPRRQSTQETLIARRSRTRTTSSSSTTSQIGLEDQSLPFISQYLREFDPIQCLGRGGFGVVFEAKKKIDDRHYAVKRIPLPNHEKSRDKVMREVKALAKLDHRNIVRYFNAWIENPPLGWLEKNDPLWVLSIQDSSSANYLSSYDTTTNRDSLFRRQKDYSKISIPSKNSVEESTADPEDSFIVFEAESQDEELNKKGPHMLSSGDSAWELKGNKSKSPLLPFSIRDCTADESEGGGKFFARPTSLDFRSRIEDTSMSEESEAKDRDSGQQHESSPPEISPSIMYLYIQQELCQKRTLQEWLRKTKDRNLLQVVQFFAQIVEAVEYIHQNKLIHRDLKPGNIFLASAECEENDEKMTVKIGDFGLATTAVSRFDGEALTPDGDVPVRVNLTGQVGTHLYMSPEQSRRLPYDFKVDIYSLGLIFFELLVPFGTDMERYEALSQVRKMNFSQAFLGQHSDEQEIISRMVAHDPEKRPTAADVKNWVKSHVLKLSPTGGDSSEGKQLATITTSYSADSPLYPVKKHVKRYSSDEERLLHKTQSCM